jgi:hypothetical protein
MWRYILGAALLSGCTVQVGQPLELTTYSSQRPACLTFNGRVDCSHGGLFYYKDTECGACPIGEPCLAIPTRNEPETGVCQ